MKQAAYIHMTLMFIELAETATRNSTTFRTAIWKHRPAHCPTARVAWQVVGEYYLYRAEASCLVLPCSNALAGEYYTGTGTPTSVLGW